MKPRRQRPRPGMRLERHYRSPLRIDPDAVGALVAAAAVGVLLFLFVLIETIYGGPR